MRKAITFLDTVRFIIASSIFVFLYLRFEGYFLAGMQEEKLTLLLLVKKYILVEGLGSFLALLFSLIVISKRYKIVAGTLIMFVSVLSYLLFAVVLSKHESWISLAADIVGLSFIAIGTSAAILVWMFIKSKLKNKLPVSKVEIQKVKTIPKTSFLLILLSLISVPATYITMLISAFITLGVCLWLLVIVLQLPRIPVFILVAVGCAPFVSLWIAFRAIKAVFFSKAEFQSGVRIDLSKKQKLKAIIQEVCIKVKTKMPEIVLLHTLPTFFVTEGKLQTFDGAVKGRVLTIGAPLIRQLSLNELRVILAHEFAHFSGRDTVYSRFVVPVYKTLGTAINDIAGVAESNKGNNAGNLLNLLLLVPDFFLRIFLTYFLTIDNILSRSRELRADWIASSNFGSNNMESGLTKVIQISKHYNASFENIGFENKNYFEKYESLLVNDVKKLEEYRQQALLEIEQEFDTHPALSTRLGSLPYQQVTDEDNSIKIEEIRSELNEDENRLSSCFQQLLKNYKDRQEIIEKAKSEFNLIDETQMAIIRSIAFKFQKELRLKEEDIKPISAYLIIGNDVDNKFESKAKKIVEMIKKDIQILNIFVMGAVIRMSLLDKYGFNQGSGKIKKLFSDLEIDLTPISQKEMPTLEAYAGMANEFCSSCK